MMKNRGLPVLIIFSFFSLFCFFSCASSSAPESEPEKPVIVIQNQNPELVQDNSTENSGLDSKDELENQESLTGIMLPEIKKKTTYFEFEDSSIMEDAIIGSPEAIKRVVSKIKNPEGKYTEEEAVLLAVLHTVMTTVWPNEPVNFTIPTDLPENVYVGIIDFIKKGIFDINAGKSDFYTLVLPCVVLCTSNQSAYFVDAEENLLEAYNQNENSVLVNYLLGILYKQKKDKEKAFYFFDKAYSMDSTCYEVIFEYANILYEVGEFEKSFELANSLDSLSNQNLKLLELCAKSALAIGKLDIAESYIGKLLQKEPDNPKSILLRAEILFEKGEYLRVSSLLDAYSKSDNSAEKYLLLRSKLQSLWNRNNAAAVSTITEALTLYPNSQDVLLWAAELASDSGLLIDGRGPLDFIVLIKNRNEDNPKLLKIEVKEFIRKNNWEKAYETSEKLVLIEPSVDSQLGLVSICLELGKNEKAAKIAKDLYAENKEDEEIQLSYIKTLIATGKSEEVGKLIETLLSTATSKMKSALYFERSKLENNEDKKLSSLRSSLTSNPRNEDALFALYQFYFNKNDYRKAQYYLKQVIALNPSDTELLKLNEELESRLY